MKTSFEDIIKVVLHAEGGFVNDPDDKGGATNHGVTQQSYSKFLGREATIDDVRKEFAMNYPLDLSNNKGIPYTNDFTFSGSGNTYPVDQNFTDNMTTYTDAIEQGKDIGNDEQLFIDNQIVNRRFP